MVESKSILSNMINNDKQSIAVIIPTYNRASTIVACIESVLSQSFPASEIIIIDDHSTDDSVNIINKFKDKIILHHTKEHSGAQVARNIGIKAAQSEWIAFLDSDDVWLPNKLEKQISTLKTVDFDSMTLVHGDCYRKYDDINKLELWNIDSINGENVYKQLLSKSGTLFPSILTSKLALEKIGFLDENAPSYHEWDTAIRLAKYCKFIHIAEPLFIYTIHENTISKNSDKSIQGYQYVIDKFKDEIIELCGENIFTNHLITNSVLALNNNQYKLGRELLKKVPNNSPKKHILQLFSYLKIKPIYFNKIIQFILRKR